MSDHLIAEADRHAKALPKMQLPTTQPTHRDIAWYVEECADLKKQLASLERENAALRAEIDEVICVCEGPSTLQELRVGFLNGISYRIEVEKLKKENAELRLDGICRRRGIPTREESKRIKERDEHIERLWKENVALKASLDAARKEQQ